ncbi:MAG TPA: hypothetical protein VMN36_08415, partial [Verrucomicrobiales bacterium]|nr:hypothetical protein [Verrucomicrobiales bacterium]
NDEEFQRLLRGYGPLSTIAGTGVSEDQNDWRPEFEGALATTVELSNPHMSMADAAGNIFIADKESHSILRVDPDGILTTFAGTHRADPSIEEGPATGVPLDSPNGLYVSPGGTVYILDLLNRRVCKVARDGFLTTVFRDPAGFGAGRGLWVSHEEDRIFYCAAGSVRIWTPSGGIETITSGLTDSGNLTVDPFGNLVVTDRGAHQVYRVAAGGERTVIAGSGDAGEGSSGVPATQCALEEVRGVAFFPNGAYLVASMKGGDIWYVDTEGIIHLFLVGSGSGNIHAGDGEPVNTPGNKISEPRAVTLTPYGDILITCNDTGFVRMVRKLRPLQLGQQMFPVPQGRVGLRWLAEPGQAYRIESSATGVGWNFLGSVPGTPSGGRREWIDPRPASGIRFYRLTQ